MRRLLCLVGRHDDRAFALTRDEEKFLDDGWPVHQYVWCLRCGRVS